MLQIPNDQFFSWVESEIARGRSVRFRSKGVSMHPFIRDGKDEILLSPCTASELAPMDVVLFKYRGVHMLHRIIQREGNRLTIKGDGSYTTEEKCTVEDVVGRVETIIRPSGKIISVDSWKWKLYSLLWNKMGVLRNPILRFLHLHAKIAK